MRAMHTGMTTSSDTGAFYATTLRRQSKIIKIMSQKRFTFIDAQDI